MTWRQQIQRQQTQRREQSLWRERQRVSAQGPRIEISGKPYLNFCSNDYLGLAQHPALADAAANAAHQLGAGSGASHLVCGHLEIHEQLENALANFVGAEAAIVFSTGYMANLAIPQSFLKSGDFLFQDRLNHASLLDAGKLCEARMVRYLHNDVNSLSQKMEKMHRRGATDSRAMVMTDAVFSMDGDVAKLQELKRVIDQEDSLLVVDDAHGFGIFGESGAGSLEAAGLSVKGPIMMVGTLGKAAGSFGAFVAGDKHLIEQLIQFGRTYTYTTALPPTVIAATLASLELIRSSDLRQQLKTNIAFFRQQAEGYPALRARLLKSHSAIQPLLITDSELALAASDQLRQNGFLISAIRPPTVPPNSARLRITLSAAHRLDELSQMLEALNHVCESLPEPRSSQNIGSLDTLKDGNE